MPIYSVSWTHAAQGVIAGRRGEEEHPSAVERLMGRKPELRLAFIQEHAGTVEELDV